MSLNLDMAIPINPEDMLRQRKVESNKNEFNKMKSRIGFTPYMFVYLRFS